MTVSAKWCAVAELAASQHGVFHRSQAAENGISAKRLRGAIAAGRVERCLSDVFVIAGAPATWRQRLMVLTLAGAVVSHRSAAALHRFDGFAEGRLEGTVRRGQRRAWPVHTWLHQTLRLDDPDLTSLDGIQCTTIERTLVDLAQVLPPRLVEPALDSALRAGATEGEIRDVAHRLSRPGRTGVGPILRLLDDPARSGAVPDSLFERLVERLLVAQGMPRPVRQFDVSLPSGSRRLDLAWPALKLGVEAHSKTYHFGRAASDDDNHRDLELAAAGWEVLYVTWSMAHDPDFFLRQLRAVIARRRHMTASGE